MGYSKFKGLVFCLLVGCLLGTVGIGAAPSLNAAPSQKEGPYERVILVRSEQELLRAIGPNRMLLLQPKVYHLSVESLEEAQNPYLEWVEVDGRYNFWLRDLKNFKMEGVGEKPVIITADAEFSFVIAFDDCSGVTITNIEARRVSEPEDFQGGAMDFDFCSGVTIEKSVLSGCGRRALALSMVEDLTFTDSVIQNCTGELIGMESCKGINLRRATLRNNGGNSDLITLLHCSRVFFDGGVIRENRIGGAALFRNMGSAGVQVKGASIIRNTAKYFSYGDRIETANLKLEGNSFGLRDMKVVKGLKPTSTPAPQGSSTLTATPLSSNAAADPGANPFTGFTRTQWSMNKDQVKGVGPGKLIGETGRSLVCESEILGSACTITYTFNGEGNLESVRYVIKLGVGGTEESRVLDLAGFRKILTKLYGEPAEKSDPVWGWPVWERKLWVTLSTDVNDPNAVVVKFRYLRGRG